mmetsp:Transcript_11847/g.25248  ORF Transcript_11847/g.25248 Transcript_11847/m.25248 type:complete len:102 (-) Transcript_11847:174-479(-)
MDLQVLLIPSIPLRSNEHHDPLPVGREDRSLIILYGICSESLRNTTLPIFTAIPLLFSRAVSEEKYSRHLEPRSFHSLSYLKGTKAMVMSRDFASAKVMLH